MTATAPGGCGGATASITLAERTLYAAAGAAPNVTAVVPVKRLPEIVTGAAANAAPGVAWPSVVLGPLRTVG